MNIPALLKKLIARQDLTEDESFEAVHAILSGAFTEGQIGGFLAALAAKGETIDEIAAFAEQNKLNLHHWFFSTDLEFYIRGGRISRTAGMFGKLLGICPLLNMDTEGRLIPRSKVRSKKKVIHEIVERMEKYAQDGLNYHGKCFVCNSDCIEDARAVAALVEERFPHLNGKVQIFSVGTTIGSHTGPGTVALFFFGSPRW